MRPYRKRGKVSGREADIRISLPGLPEIRERRKAPGDHHSAMKGGQAIERWLIGYYTNRDPREGLTHDLSRMGKDDEGNQASAPSGPRVPTFAEFWPRYITGHCEANRLRAATIRQKVVYFNQHLGPAFGAKPLDQIAAVDIETFKGVPQIAIQGVMWHSDIRMTARYMHLAPAVAMDAAKALNRPATWRHGGATPAPVQETI